MGRRHLSRAALVAFGLLLFAAPAPALASPTWQLVARGNARGPLDQLTGYVALDRPSATAWSARTGKSGAAALRRADFSRNALVAVFGPFGCKDGRVAVASLTQRGSTLAVSLRESSPAPGTVECMAIFETFRLLTVPKAELHKPYPTHATVALARA
ncbi:MAG TPA: hypothetical protein VGH35_11875 [Gaiellaceae bacterium]